MDNNIVKPVVADEPKGIKRERKVKLSDDVVQNVKMFACSRLNKAVVGIRVFGQCFGSKYKYEDGQISKAETALNAAVKSAIENLRTGKKITEAGIRL